MQSTKQLRDKVYFSNNHLCTSNLNNVLIGAQQEK